MGWSLAAAFLYFVSDKRADGVFVLCPWLEPFLVRLVDCNCVTFVHGIYNSSEEVVEPGLRHMLVWSVGQRSMSGF